MIKAGCPESGIVLDPFSGSGTTGIVARRLKRDYVGLDLSIDYIRLSRERLDLDALEAWNGGSGIPDDSDISELPLFKKENT
jgi:DNA modification methylase